MNDIADPTLIQKIINYGYASASLHLPKSRTAIIGDSNTATDTLADLENHTVIRRKKSKIAIGLAKTCQTNVTISASTEQMICSVSAGVTTL